jgi:hypothetical protein
MATIYYATDGRRSWSNRRNWLTDQTECRWFQGGSDGNFCDANGTLLMINQSNNTLKGTIPDEIGLLTSLTVIESE